MKVFCSLPLAHLTKFKQTQLDREVDKYMGITIYPRDQQNLEALIADRFAISMDEMEITERLRVYNNNLDTQYLLHRIKHKLAAAIAELHFNNHTQDNEPTSDVSVAIPGKSAHFGWKKKDKRSLDKMFQIIAHMEEVPFVELNLSYGLRPSILAQMLQEVNQDALLAQIHLIDYQCLFTLNQGQELHLSTLTVKDGLPQLVEIEPTEDLSLTESVNTWSSSDFIISASYPQSAPAGAHERIITVMTHFWGLEGSNSGKESLEEDWEGLYNPNLHINVTIPSHRVSAEVALLQELAKEVMAVGGTLSFTCHLRANDRQFAILVIEGDENGITAKTACLSSC